MIKWLADRYWSWRLGVQPFRPCVNYNREGRITTMKIEDTLTIWRNAPNTIVELGYNTAGDLIGIQIWDDVRKRPAATKEPGD